MALVGDWIREGIFQMRCYMVLSWQENKARFKIIIKTGCAKEEAQVSKQATSVNPHNRHWPQYLEGMSGDRLRGGGRLLKG